MDLKTLWRFPTYFHAQFQEKVIKETFWCLSNYPRLLSFMTLTSCRLVFQPNLMLSNDHLLFSLNPPTAARQPIYEQMLIQRRKNYALLSSKQIRSIYWQISASVPSRYWNHGVKLAGNSSVGIVRHVARTKHTRTRAQTHNMWLWVAHTQLMNVYLLLIASFHA